MNITKKGIVWELINSLWIAISFFGFPWGAFLYIGKTAKRAKWMFYAAIYFVLQMAFIIGCAVSPYILGMWCAFGLMISYVIGITHSFMARKEYLIAREYIIENGLDELENQKIRESIRRDFEKQEPAFDEIVEEEEEFSYEPHLYADEAKINLNISSKEELLALPGVTSEIADKAINFRTKFGGFASTREFVEILQIDSRYLSEIQKKASVK